MRVCELRQKEVINARDCKVLGCVADVEIDMVSRTVTKSGEMAQGNFVGFLGGIWNM